MSENIILTTGVYDLIKDHLRRKQVSKKEEEILLSDLKQSKQVLRRNLPNDIVTVDRIVEVKNSTTNDVQTITFVGPQKAKPKKNKHSILSEIGIAIVGYKVGDKIKWPSTNGEIEYEILSVEALAIA